MFKYYISLKNKKLFLNEFLLKSLHRNFEKFDKFSFRYSSQAHINERNVLSLKFIVNRNGVVFVMHISSISMLIWAPQIIQFVHPS